MQGNPPLPLHITGEKLSTEHCCIFHCLLQKADVLLGLILQEDWRMRCEQGGQVFHFLKTVLQAFFVSSKQVVFFSS